MIKPSLARLAIAGILLGQICPVAEARSSGRLPTGPAAGDQDISPFYRWAGALPAAPGRPLRKEAMPADLVPPHAGEAFRILYTSTDGRWNSGILPVSGALYLPQGKAPPRGWSLIIWAHGTLGVADSCAPSFTGANQRDRAYIDRWLAKGYAVVAPDYQGLGAPGPHPYLNWRAEGQSVLDAGRAALRFENRIANRAIVTGQSQGSGAAIGAARLAASYAPDLRVRGVIATALVPTFPGAARPGSTASPGNSPYYLIYRIVGGALPDGSPPAEQYLTDKGKILLQAARTQCNPREVAAREDVTLANAFAVPVNRLEAELGPVGAQTRFRTTFPLMLGTGLADELIPASRQALAVAAICGAGNTVIWKRYPGVKHGETLTVSFEDAEAFAEAGISGRKVRSDCGQLKE